MLLIHGIIIAKSTDDYFPEKQEEKGKDKSSRPTTKGQQKFIYPPNTVQGIIERLHLRVRVIPPPPPPYANDFS